MPIALSTGYVLKVGDGSCAKLKPCGAAPQAIVTIRSRQQALVQLNQTMDYSYMDTPLSRLQNASDTVFRPHIPQENWGMPAYVAGSLVWGSPPKAVRTLLQPLII